MLDDIHDAFLHVALPHIVLLHAHPCPQIPLAAASIILLVHHHDLQPQVCPHSLAVDDRPLQPLSTCILRPILDDFNILLLFPLAPITYHAAVNMAVPEQVFCHRRPDPICNKWTEVAMVAPSEIQGTEAHPGRRKSSENLARRATQALSSLLEERAPAQSGVVAGGRGSGGEKASGGGGGADTGAGAGGKGETLYTPWSKEGFHRRLKTFSASTWFDKPPLLSAIECARYGWVNVDVDEVECESCKGRLIAKFHHSFKPEAKERAAKALSEQATTKAHSKLCPWADNPVPKKAHLLPVHREPLFDPLQAARL